MFCLFECLSVLITKFCLTLYDPMNCSPPGSSAHGISKARTLDWVAIHFSRGLPNPGIELGSPALKVDSLPSEPPVKPIFECLVLLKFI